MKDENFVKLRDIYISDSDNEDQDDARHYNLLKSIKKFTGKERVRILRNEAVTSTNRIKSTDRITLKDLIDGEDVGKDISMSKKVLSSQKILRVPAHKGEQEKIRRVIGYEEAKKVVSKWDPIVKDNRKLKHMTFPLEQIDMKIINNPTALNRDHKPMTEMEREVAAILGANKDFNFEKKFLSKSEQRALDAMSLEQAQERRAKLQRQRALMSYYGSKMKRDGKIKSKRHHRVARKAKQKEAMKSLDHLKETDPHAYKQWLDVEEKKRAEERMTLKHKGGSRRMKKQTIYGKYNKESRQAVQDMLQLGKERSARMRAIDERDSEQTTDDDDTADDNKSKNPWLISKTRNAVVNDNDENDSDGIENLEVTKRLTSYEDYDAIKSDANDDVDVDRSEDDVMIESFEDDRNNASTEKRNEREKTKRRKRIIDRTENINKENLIDVRHFLRVENGTGIVDSSQMAKTSIQMAFEDDNVLEEFVAEKRNHERRETPKDIDLTIAGWGEWTGPGIQISRRKKKKVPTATLR